ncbi:MAG: fibronectin type III domain-containing protein [Bacteroidales bacterium]|nr:fibronectin type III domain-containing protein [Bacteroidales bacterium]
MKHQEIVKILAIALGLLSVVSCNKGGGNEGPSSAIAVTGEYADLTKNSVTLYGWCNQKEEEGLYAVYGFEYSDSDLTTAASTVTAKSRSKDSSNKYSCDLTGLTSGTKYYYRAYSRFNGTTSYGDVKTFTTTKPSCPSGAVDLGLSVFWATCNLGAISPEEYGRYYMWADKQEVSAADIGRGWESCPYHTGSDSETGWTKYVLSDKASYWSGSGSPDNKRVLDPDDDVAHVKLGGKWRMPTDAEWDELVDNCTWTWTDNYNETGVAGQIVTGTKPGYTDKSIFLPAAGMILHKDHSQGTDGFGFYWRRELSYDDPSYAYCISFYEDGYWRNFYITSRVDGLSVRPVTE